MPVKPTTRKGRYLVLRAKMLARARDEYWRLSRTSTHEGRNPRAQSGRYWLYRRLGKQAPLVLSAAQKHAQPTFPPPAGPLTYALPPIGGNHPPHPHSLVYLHTLPRDLWRLKGLGSIDYFHRRVEKLGRRVKSSNPVYRKTSLSNWHYWYFGIFPADDPLSRRPREGIPYDEANHVTDGGYWPGDPLDPGQPFP